MLRDHSEKHFAQFQADITDIVSGIHTTYISSLFFQKTSLNFTKRLKIVLLRMHYCR